MPRIDWDRRPVLLTAWAATLPLLILMLGLPPVQRTQEARVMETAREMLGRPLRAWMIPRLNGEVRLRKPPLAYWMSAAGFDLLGVNEFAGRLPTALLGWVTLAVVYLTARWAFGGVSGVFAAATLLGSYMFYRHTRLAETDAPMTCFVTLAIAAIWRGSESIAQRERIFWFHLSAIAAALAILAKGPPAAFIFVFLVGLTIVTQHWKLPLDWLASGAPLTLLIIALPWLIYVKSTPEAARQMSEELRVVSSGEDHPQPAYVYLPQLLAMVAPWSGFFVLAIAHGIRRWRDEPHVRIVLVWLASIFVPLCLMGNRQRHYLLPLMPPAMLLVAWLLDRVWRKTAEKSLVRALEIVFYGTVIVLAGVGVAAALAGKFQRGPMHPEDLAVGIAILGAAVVTLTASRRAFISGLAALVATSVVTMPLIAGIWWPARFERDPRIAAAELRQHFGDAPYCFWGPNLSLPLCFAMRTTIPQADKREELAALYQQHPDLVVIAQTKAGIAPPPLPPAFTPELQINLSEQKFEVYRAKQ